MNSEAITAVASIASAVVIALSAFAAIRQMRNVQRGQTFEGTEILLQRWESTEMRAARRYVIDELPARLRTQAYRGRAVADYVVVKTADGYRAVFALCELDPAFTAKIVLLADQRNGAAMGSDVGPFRIVIPDEKRHARWVRKVTELDVVTAP